MSISHSNFNLQLFEWHDGLDRYLPWKTTQDPYKIWLSEVILQQTRVAQGTPYYLRFCEAFPTIKDLANASEDKVLRVWQGLGYYSRARNMHATAKYIANHLQGDFPKTYIELIALKGIGHYTAAAIASFAYGLPHAVVDGNVYRVLSRYFGDSIPIDSQDGKNRFKLLAEQLLDRSQPAKWNQAIMDLGAVVCTPKNPFCNQCPLQDQCKAKEENTIELYPVKTKRIQKTTRHFHYLLLKEDGFTFIEKRSGKDIWKGLYQFPLMEYHEGRILKDAASWHLDLVSNVDYICSDKQVLTHQKIIGHFFEVEVSFQELNLPDSYIKVAIDELSNYAFPKIIHKFILQKL
jgi:A/G-specific adenine glycosylase